MDLFNLLDCLGGFFMARLTLFLIFNNCFYIISVTNISPVLSLVFSLRKKRLVFNMAMTHIDVPHLVTPPSSFLLLLCLYVEHPGVYILSHSEVLYGRNGTLESKAY